MDDDERQYWFDIMPSMTDEQIDRLYNILDTERKKLEKLEKKYQNEIKTLNEKHLIEWQEFQMSDSKKKIKKAESEDKDGDAEDVLSMLNDL
jgi:vacuolar-type H+-ATPase subunit I/STV1